MAKDVQAIPDGQAETPEVERTTSRQALILTVVGVLVFILIVMGLNFSYASTLGKDKGLFGDLFGASNALFSGLALAGVVLALILQAKDLDNQRKELKKAAEAHVEQLELNNRVQEFNAKVHSMNLGFTMLSHIIDNEELSKNFAGELGTWDKDDAFMQMMLNRFVITWWSKEYKFESDEAWTACREDVRTVLSGDSKFRQHWKEMKHIYPIRFEEFIDELATEANVDE